MNRQIRTRKNPAFFEVDPKLDLFFRYSEEERGGRRKISGI